MDFFKKMFGQPQANTYKSVKKPNQLEVVKINNAYNNSPYNTSQNNISQNSNALKNTLNVISWNIEDFVSINGLYNSEKINGDPNNQTIQNDPSPELRELFFFKALRQQDVILIQEWKNKNYEGDLFMCKLNNKKNKYAHDSVDRVAIIYNTDIFDKSKTNVYKIPLAYEKPSFIEKTYTTGRQKYNMLTILYPKNENNLPICVINFHLSAFSPQYHSDFHKRQLTGLLESSLQKIRDENIKNFGLIIGGDTNYRNLGASSDELLGSLLSLDYNLPCGVGNGYCGNGTLKDVCEKNCLNTKTQSFGCVHEKGIAKKGMKFLRQNIYTSESTPTSSINDNRLDFIATNLTIDYNYTKIMKLCDLSDHSAILSRMFWKIDNNNLNYNSNFSQNGSGIQKMKRTKSKNKKNKIKKNKTSKNKTSKNKTRKNKK